MMQDQILERASLLFEQRRFTEARKLLMEVLTAEPNNVRVLIMLAEIHMEQDDLKPAMELIESAIALEPDYDVLFNIRARILLMQEKFGLAFESIEIAITLDPYESANFALLGHIQMQRKKFKEALVAANNALEIDASDVFALNVRSAALLKLNQKEDSFETIAEALNEDPNNAYTHANFGWGLLEKGDKDKALEHFAESLKSDPNFEYAQAGMAEALKSKYAVYRWFLKYAFWMGNLTSKNQWVFIIGFFLVSRFLRTIANKNEALQPYLYPVIGLLAAFALSTWLMTPLSNLLFRLNKYGKHLLTEDQKKSSMLVGSSLIFLLIGLVWFLLTDHPVGLALAIFGFTMMLPLGRLFEKPAGFFKTYIGALLVLVLLSLIEITRTGELFNIFTIVYFIGFFVFQWAANYFSIRHD